MNITPILATAWQTLTGINELTGVLSWSGLLLSLGGAFSIGAIPKIKSFLKLDDPNDLAEQRIYAKKVGTTIICLGFVLLAVGLLGHSSWTTSVDTVAVVCILSFSAIWVLAVGWFFPGAVWRKFRKRNPQELQPPTPFDPDNEKGQLELYKIAVDTRKLELDLFWKRSGFFWGFLAVTLAGFFAAREKQQGFAQLLLALIGVIEALCWWLVNRGSKYWHENWEQMVRKLEKSPGLFNQTSELQRKGYLGAAAYSVSRITIFFSFCTLVLFVGLAGNEVVRLFVKSPSKFLGLAGPLMLSLSTITAGLYAWLDGVSGSAGGDPDYRVPAVPPPSAPSGGAVASSSLAGQVQSATPTGAKNNPTSSSPPRIPKPTRPPNRGKGRS